MVWNLAVGENIDGQPDLHLKGMICLYMKSIDKAQIAADELKKILQPRVNKKLMRYYYHLVGMIELETDDSSKAITYFKRALSLLPFQHSELDDHALFIYPLASAYYEAGDLEKAQEQHKKIASLTTGRLFSGDIFAKSFYMLGEIYQEKGWKEKAVEHYAQFIKLWKDVDPGTPEVEDAKERLNRLRAES